MKKLLSTAILSLAAIFANAAVPVSSCDVNDINSPAIKCFSMVGPDTNGENGFFTGLTGFITGLKFNDSVGNTFTTPWYLVDKTNDDYGSQEFTFLNNPHAKNGTLELSGSLLGYYALTLQTNTGYTAYLIGATGQDSFEYSSNKNLKHASLWTFPGGSNSGGGGCGSGNCPPVPEASTFAMMLAGISAFAFLFRRRMAK